jgi:glutathione S-transferase
MTDRSLLYTAGSPFARAVRIVLDELCLDYERKEEITTPTVEDRARATPTLQVPTFWDGDVHLWESTLIIEYLLSQYDSRAPELPTLARGVARQETYWRDRLILSTLHTLGTAATTISQMKWGGISVGDSDYLQRNAERLPHLFAWLELELVSDTDGFLPGCLSVQDIFLTCHIDFIKNRPIDLDARLNEVPKLQGLIERVRSRETLKNNPIYWWEPGVTGYEDDGTPIYQESTS